jgi:hypothetical protein
MNTGVFKVSQKLEMRESTIMLSAILVVLLLLWLVGFYGGFCHHESDSPVAGSGVDYLESVECSA